MLRRGAVSLAILAAVLAGLYVGAGIIVYEDLSHVSPHCGDPALRNTPSDFAEREADTRYEMPAFESWTIESRDPGISLSAWYVPGETVDGPAVVVVHGLNGCKRKPEVLLAGGMLHRAGFGVLLIDVRDHGESTIEDGRHSGGIEEHRDVLGAWDRLVAEGHPPARIGLYGQSFGAGMVMIAAGEEPRVAAVWEDSGYADIERAISDELAREGYPRELAPAGTLAARLIAGDDLTSLSPIRATERLGGRHVFVTHGDADTRLSVAFAHRLLDGLARAGAKAESWIVPGAAHVEAIRVHRDEYERRVDDFFSRALGAP